MVRQRLLTLKESCKLTIKYWLIEPPKSQDTLGDILTNVIFATISVTYAIRILKKNLTHQIEYK